MIKDIPKALKPFAEHGVDFGAEFDNQAIASCPFCGKARKFYVNKNSGLWDCKSDGKAGNVHDFLREIASQNAGAMQSRNRLQLAEDRKLCQEAFKGYDIGWDGARFTIPVRDFNGVTQDIRLWQPSKGIKTTTGCHTSLFNAELMAKNKNATVYVCEGEWDAIALAWLLKQAKAEGVCVGVPGAATFKADWLPWFQNRNVVVLYDNDSAGEQGELTVFKRLNGTAKTLRFLHWPQSLPSGFDVRDFVVKHSANPKRCVKDLLAFIHDGPRQGKALSLPQKSEAKASPKAKATKRKTPATFEEVCSTFRKWLFLNDTHAIEMMLAVTVSHKMDGDPLWLFIVSPPGGAKTETLSALNGYDDIYTTSSLTPHALISGASWKGDEDPSLIPRLNGKILVIKDFTSILSMRDVDKDEIFGILRDAYDGYCGKVFGNGIERKYESRFTLLAAVTPQIYSLATSHQQLGERFLKICVGTNLLHKSEDEIIAQAIANVDRETSMRSELQDVVTSFLSRPFPKTLPKMPEGMLKRVIALAKFGSRMRGTVQRDMYRQELVTARPSAEVGSRLGKQLAKLAISLAVVHGHETVTEDEYRIVRKTILDTIPQRSEDVVRALWQSAEGPMGTNQVALLTKYPQATIARMLSDMHILDVVTKSGPMNRAQWTLSPYIVQAIKDSGLYATDEEVNRPSIPTKARIIIHRGKPETDKPRKRGRPTK